MKKAAFALLLALFYAGPNFAQSDSLGREVGFSTHIILKNIFNSQGAPVSLMLKKQKSENKWMRYGIETYITRNEHVDFQYNYLHQSALLRPSLGIEKRRPLTKKWLFLYGADAFVNLDYVKTRQISQQYSFNENIRVTERYSYGAGLRPFIGITYSISPRLYLSTEASASLFGSWTSIDGTDTSLDYPARDLRDDSWNFSLAFRPASAIFVYYRF